MRIFGHVMTNSLVLAFAATAMVAAAGADAFGTLAKRFATGGVYRAEMAHTHVDAFTGDTTVTYGRVWLARDGYKVETSDQVIVVHAGVSKVHHRHQNKLILSRYDPDDDDFAPARFLGGHGDRYRVSETRRNGRPRINLTFTDPFDLLRSARIDLGSDGLPVAIDAVDQADNRMRTRFEFGRFMADSTGVFRLPVPAGTQIVDLRKD
jgi:hypothetical protein